MPFLLRLMLLLIALAVLAYAAVFAWLCLRESSVARKTDGLPTYDGIIVLGAQVKPDGNPSVQLSWRLDTALEAWNAHPVPVVVCGAQGADEPMPEAIAMRDYLVQRGIPETEILLDPDSFNTRQNLTNAKELLPENGDFLLVTSDYHVPRALAQARDVGLSAVGLGSPCKAEFWLKNHARETLAWVKYWGIKYLRLPLS